MSGKRGATSDLNHDNWDAEEEVEEAGTFAQATNDQLKGRVIKKAKRRGNGANDGTPGIFSGFAGFSSAAPATGTFDFLKSPAMTSPAVAGGGGNSSNNLFGGISGNGVAVASFTSSSPPSSTQTSSAPSTIPPPSFSSSGGFNFAGLAPKANGGLAKWTCDSCMVQNDADKSSCACCDAPKPGGDEPDVRSFGAKPAKWTCDTCMVSNDADKDSCPCCETPKPGSVKKASSIPPAFSIHPGGGFKFGSSTTTSSSSSSTPSSGFTFGQTSASSAATTGFQFGGTSSTSSSQQPLTGFKFGANAAAASAPGGTEKKDFTFGSAPKVVQKETIDEDSSSGSTSNFSSQSTSDSKSKPVVTSGGFGGFAFGSAANNATKSAVASSSNHANSVKTEDHSKEEENDDDDLDYPDEYYIKLRLLNQQVSEWIKRHVDENPMVLLLPVFKDYEKYVAALSVEFKMGSAASNNSGSNSGSKKAVTMSSGTNSPSSNSGSGGSKTVTFGGKDSSTSNLPLLGSVFGNVPAAAVAETKKAEEAPKGLFTFGASKPTAAATTTSVQSSTFSFVSSTAATSSESSPSKGMFSFGSKNISEPAKTGGTFTFGSASAATAAAPSTFSFGSSGTTSGTTSGFSFGAAAAAATSSATSSQDNDDEESDEPPKVEVNTVVEEDSIHSVRCKLYYKHGQEFKEKGLGMLHLKKVEDGKKTQMVVRAETNLGNILLNILLNEKMLMKQSKNNVQFVCVPNPPIKGIEGPVSMLIKVKSEDMAKELVRNVEEVVKTAA